ncbi:hypothetical protein [Methylophaga sp.]|uniref:hypothetical protein n=1 Tax=Methylophaga sp. TaxID=2024840 RepID=UPI003A9501FA
MNRHEALFHLHHNETLEKYTSTFWARVDKFIIFMQLFLSSMVFADVSGTMAYGAALTILTLFSVVYSPSTKANQANAQNMRYVRVRMNKDKMTDEQLNTELESLAEFDSDVLGCFFNPAHWRSAIYLDLEVKNIEPLTKLEKIMAWLGGDLPPGK